jgi:hypothetical protein
MSSTKTKESSNVAEVEVSGNKAPVLTPGSISPETLRRFENACKNFFRNKKIDAAEQVSAIAGNMQDPLVSDWYWTDEERINKLSFETFIKEMCDKWLPKGWENDLHRRVLGTKQNGEIFWEWAVHLRGLNASLRNLPDHLDDKELRNQLEVNLDKSLVIACDEDKVNDIAELKDWLTAVKNTDKRVRRDRERARADAEEAVRVNANKRSATMAGLSEPSRRFNSAPFAPRKDTSNWKTDRPSNSQGTHDGKRLGKLTDEERAYLVANKGCFKCRIVNAGHLARDCPLGN